MAKRYRRGEWRAYVTGAIAVAALAWPLASWAQNPSANDLIQSLTPRSRGIRPATMPPGDTQAPPSATTPGETPAAVPAHPHGPATHTPRQAAAQPAAPEAPPSASLTVEFRTGSAELTPQATHTLDTLGQALSSQQLAGDKFRIEGHTDTVGSPDLNKTLSQRRAEAVAQYIESKFGIAPDRLQAVGMGEEGLAVPTPPQTPELRNRRVVVVNESA
jgi:OmpA-OmpF porin, OOP family